MSIAHPPQPVSDGGHLDPKHLWESAVCLASIKAREALPDSNGRVDKALALVLDGAVELLDAHSARVTSQRDGETQYYTEEVTHVTDAYVMAQARAEFHDGRVFRGAADSTPDNVGKQVKPHWRRMALTRAKARCLRDALNINLVAVEELD